MDFLHEFQLHPENLKSITFPTTNSHILLYRSSLGISFSILKNGNCKVAFNASVFASADRPVSALKITTPDKEGISK
jgi:hypothetical protein